MDRLTFFNLISGIRYPEMLIEFYDQFLTLFQLFFNRTCAITVLDSSDRSITFCIDYTEDKTITAYLSSVGPYYVIYGRSISIHSEALSDKQLKLTLQ